MAKIENWSKVLIKPTHSLGKGVKVLQKYGLRIALVVDNNNKLQMNDKYIINTNSR